MRNLGRMSAIALAALLATAALFAADKGRKDDSAKAAKEKAMMDAMMKAATPGEAHKKLEPFVGTFDAKVKMWMDPTKPQEESSSTSENKWVLGNRYVEMRYEGTFMGQPFSGVGYTGYDNILKKYVGTWMDTAGTGIMMTTGRSDASGKVTTMTGSTPDPTTGKAQAIREKITVSDNDHHTMEMWGPGPDGKMFKMLEITYSRKK